MIPAFSLHRTQDLLHILRTLKKTGKIKLKTQVFVDSPMGIGATQIYSDCHAVNSVHFSDALRQSTADPFKFPQRVMTQESWRYKTVAAQRGPQVVIAGAGMMNGGRILRHAINYLPDENSSILFVGYQGEGTLGRRIAEGEKRVAIDDQPVHVRAQVNRLHGMSSHADQDRLLEWLKESGAQTVYLVHGGDEQRQALKAKIDRKIKVITP